MLRFNSAWRFRPPSRVDGLVVNEFDELIGRIAAQGDRQKVLEHFKHYFAGAAGKTSSWSSNASWAQTDLYECMSDAARNAPLFIAAFCEACEDLHSESPEFAIPDTELINEVLARHDVRFEIRPPNLVERDPLAIAIPVAPQPLSFDDQAQETIQQSLQQSERFLFEGRDRQAVQEVLWLLETVSIAFQGLDTGAGTVQGKYFNKIVDDLRKQYKGKSLEQILDWVRTLHGYLSSPTGGGVRHGVDLKVGLAVQRNEARLFCNLIRSYISFSSRSMNA